MELMWFYIFNDFKRFYILIKSILKLASLPYFQFLLLPFFHIFAYSSRTCEQSQFDNRFERIFIFPTDFVTSQVIRFCKKLKIALFGHV